MEERDHYLSKQHHRELLIIAEVERRAHSVEVASPSRLDHLLARSGDSLISLGLWLKNRSTAPDLSGECV